MHSTISKMSKHVEKLQKEAEEARDLLDAAKKKVGSVGVIRCQTKVIVLSDLIGLYNIWLQLFEVRMDGWLWILCLFNSISVISG